MIITFPQQQTEKQGKTEKKQVRRTTGQAVSYTHLDVYKRQLNSWKRYYYNEEFDPGSGWTLATGLTHADVYKRQQLATVTYDRIQALYKDSVVTSQRKDEVEAMYKAAVAAERAAHHCISRRSRF